MSLKRSDGGVDRLESVAEELGVEADLHRLGTVVGRRKRLLRLPDVLGLSAHRQLTLCEAQPQGRVALREQAPRRTTSRSSSRGEHELVLELLGQQLAVVRELAVDPARSARPPHAEDHVVLVHSDVRLSPRVGRQARHPGARGREIASSRSSGSERRLLHRQAIGVGRGHTIRPASNRTRMPVSTGRLSSREADRDRDRLDEGRAARDGNGSVDVGQLREVLGAVGVDTIARAAGADRQHPPRRDVVQRNRCPRQRSHDLEQQAAGEDDVPRATSAGIGTRREISMSVARTRRGAGGRQRTRRGAWRARGDDATRETAWRRVEGIAVAEFIDELEGL